jgi:N utilization substance protein B
MQELFTYSFDETQIPDKIADVIKNRTAIDGAITAAASEWPIEKIARIDLAILRLAVYELQFTKETPAKVIIDEAVELAKSFGNDNSPKFINGVLGNIYGTIEK